MSSSNSSASKVSHDNPFREGGAIHRLFGFMRQKQVFTRGEVLAFAAANGIEAKTASAMTSALVSPTKENEGDRDARGHICTKGHLYYMETPERKTVDGKREKAKWRLRWREVALEPLNPKKVRVPKAPKAEKVVKAKVVKAKKATKVKAEKVVVAETPTETADPVVA